MTALPPIPPVRRSAIEPAHALLGARWISDTVRWPEGYGAVGGAEAAAVEAGAGLAEIGPFEEWLLRGPGAVAAAGRIGGGVGMATVGRVMALGASAASATAWILGPDEVLLVGPIEGGSLDSLTGGLASDDVSVIEMTGARTSVRLAGPSAPSILAELCAADTTPATIAEGAMLQASMAGVRAFIAREDVGAHPGYTIMVARDEALYVWDAMRAIGAAHGLTPVGPAALAGAR